MEAIGQAVQEIIGDKAMTDTHTDTHTHRHFAIHIRTGGKKFSIIKIYTSTARSLRSLRSGINKFLVPLQSKTQTSEVCTLARSVVEHTLCTYI